MKKNFVFDVSETDMINVDEETVVRDTGVSAENVKASVMKEIKTGKKKHHKKKVFAIIGIAAAIAAVSTFTVGATTGGFNPLFGELFAGQPANGFFSGKDISIKSDELKINFIGIAGDNDQMCGIYEIERKDGADIFDDDAIGEIYADQDNVEVTHSLWARIWSGELFNDNPYAVNRGGQVWYDLVDAKTLRAYVGFSDETADIKGERMTITQGNVGIFHVDEVIFEFDTREEYEAYLEEHEEELEEKSKSFAEDQYYHLLDHQYVVTTYRSFPLEYELSVTLNYQSTERNMDSSVGNHFTWLNTDWEITGMTAKSFRMEFSTVTEEFNVYQDFDMSTMDSWSMETQHDFSSMEKDIVVTITLKDGTKVIGEGYASRSSYSPDGTGSATWNIQYYEEKSHVPYALDPNEIVSIDCGGTELLN